MNRKEDLELASLKREVSKDGVSIALQKSLSALGQTLTPEMLADGNRRLTILADPLRYNQ